MRRDDARRFRQVAGAAYARWCWPAPRRDVPQWVPRAVLGDDCFEQRPIFVAVFPRQDRVWRQHPVPERVEARDLVLGSGRLQWSVSVSSAMVMPETPFSTGGQYECGAGLPSASIAPRWYLTFPLPAFRLARPRIGAARNCAGACPYWPLRKHGRLHVKRASCRTRRSPIISFTSASTTRVNQRPRTRATPEFLNKIAPQRPLLRGPSNATEGNFKTVSFGEQPSTPWTTFS